jgi:hypothetical protein
MPKSESSNQQTCRLIWNQKVRLPMISLPTYKSSYQVVQICDIRPFQSQVCLTLNGPRTPIKERESSSISTQRFQMKTELNSLIHSSCINRQRHTLNCRWGQTTKTYHETLHKGDNLHQVLVQSRVDKMGRSRRRRYGSCVTSYSKWSPHSRHGCACLQLSGLGLYLQNSGFWDQASHKWDFRSSSHVYQMCGKTFLFLVQDPSTHICAQTQFKSNQLIKALWRSALPAWRRPKWKLRQSSRS